MDLETLFYVAIAVLYLLSRVLGGKKKAPQKGVPQRQQRPQQTPTRRAEPAAANRAPELDEALREIRRALGWEEPEPARPTEPAPAPQTQPSPEPTPTFEPAGTREPRAVPPARPIPRTAVEKADRRPVPQAKVESARPRVVPEARLEPSVRTEEFRSVETPRWDAREAAHRQVGGRPAASESARSDAARVQRARALRQKLLNPESARDAFLMAEILAPRSRRR